MRRAKRFGELGRDTLNLYMAMSVMKGTSHFVELVTVDRLGIGVIGFQYLTLQR